MGHRDLTFEIQAPPERVYALLIDPDRLPDWMLGLKSVATTGPLDRPGSELTLKFGPPFTVTSKVISSEPGVRHQVRAREMLGLVTCTTTATLEPAGAAGRRGGGRADPGRQGGRLRAAGGGHRRSGARLLTLE